MRRTPTRALPAALVALALMVAATACADGPTAAPSDGDADPDAGAPPSPTEPSPPSGTTPPVPSRQSGAIPTPRVAGTIATELTSPWGLAFLPDGSALVSERDTAEIKAIPKNGGTPRTVGTVDGVVAGGEGGLLGIAVAPTFDDEPYVYAYYTAANDNRIVRMRYADGELGGQDVLFDGIAKATIHNGGRIAFGPDGHLYATTGDASEQPDSQRPDSPNGKILRLTPDGDPAPGNPNADSPIWSSGHRNSQGLAWESRDRLWAAEFGQDTWDELNLIRRGGNYGWPEVEGKGGEPEYVDPAYQWSTDVASPSGLAYAENTLWMAGLRGRRLWAIPVADGALAGDPKAFFTEKHGRLRTVEPAPDGSLWLVTSNTDGRGNTSAGDDRILRLTLSD